MSIIHSSRPASVGEIAAEMDRRGAVIESLEAALSAKDAALSSQSLIIKNAALSSGASEIAGPVATSLSEARDTAILPGGQDCATALSEAREEIERLKGLLHANGKPRFNEAMRRVEAAEHEARVHSDAADGYRDELLSLRASLRKGAEEIEVTDEMIEAGKEAANGWTDRYMDGAEFVNWDEALPDIFRRMLALVSGSREDGDG